MESFRVVNDAEAHYFDLFPPAHEEIKYSKLPKAVNTEINCITDLD
ncbi:MAG: hypothetical protein ACI9A7_000995 [Cyclobacteriaceae bacterium]